MSRVHFHDRTAEVSTAHSGVRPGAVPGGGGAEVVGSSGTCGLGRLSGYNARPLRFACGKTMCKY